MTDKTISVKMDESDITRISIFLENANQRFKSSNIIKNYEELNLFLFIYRNRIGGKDTRFKDLQAFTQKSDVYISNFIKTSIQNGSINIINSDKDKRQKLYVLTEKAKETVTSFGFNASISDKPE
tara:strand:+ start:175 stop:549 length:375 start_codon:yes stop_codon:yes gene_type:complete